MSSQQKSGAGSEAPESREAREARDSSWPNVLFHIHVHLAAMYGLFLIFTEAYYSTTLYGESAAVIFQAGGNRTGRAPACSPSSWTLCGARLALVHS